MSNQNKSHASQEVTEMRGGNVETKRANQASPPPDTRTGGNLQVKGGSQKKMDAEAEGAPKTECDANAAASGSVTEAER